MRRTPNRIVYLVPGFFGFTSAGSVSYFHDVERRLAESLASRGAPARVIRCRTQPTASIPRRAEVLRRKVVRTRALDADELHFVGHSTGGLDVRMLLTPGVRIGAGDSAERIAARTRSATSVTTPHHGTPLANHFATVQGHSLLLALSALATTSPGRSAVVAAARSLTAVAKWGDRLGATDTALDRLAQGMLAGVRVDRKGPLWNYLREIEGDQGAVLQLTPEGSDLFDAAVTDRPGIHYGCVVAGVPRPRGNLLTLGSLLDPADTSLAMLFRLLHALASRPHPRYPCPAPSPATRRALRRGLGFDATPATNDGIVPTLSQLHGRLLHVARADHLDVVGHFTLAGATGNWLPSGAGFTREAFTATWDAVAEAIAEASGDRQ